MFKAYKCVKISMKTLAGLKQKGGRSLDLFIVQVFEKNLEIIDLNKNEKKGN